MKNLLLAFALLTSTIASATHIVGGEIFYDSLGGDQYKITFEIYRDCSGSGFDNPLNYTVFNADGTPFAEYPIANPATLILPILYDDPCVTPPNDICIERAIYIDTITLPATLDGYYISYQRCCWANNIQNIIDPGNWGLTISTSIPGTNLVGVFDNNCARFSNYPPLVLCSNNPLSFDHAATDIDGDSLVYSLCTPKTVALGALPTYDPEFPAPYTDVNWEPGFSGTVPFGPGSTITIDPATGMMNFLPSQIGTFVASVCVEEWRAGVLINQKMRTFGYRVVACDVEEPMTVSLLGAGALIEDCSSAGFVVLRDSTNEAVTIQVIVSGTATNGTDYNFLPNTITIPIGVATDTISITPYLDHLTEGDETILFSVIVENPCDGTFDTTSAVITIVDYIDLTISFGDSINICEEFNEFGSAWCTVQNGVEPYAYNWNPIPYANNDSITFPASDLNPNLTPVYVDVLDGCGKIIQSGIIPVYHQCPLQVPNVITMNGDDINDEFIIHNLEDFDNVHLQIFNRWGNLVFEDLSYQNDWRGYDISGNPLVDGVYTYVVTPESFKFEYDDEERTLYTAHGFVHIVK
ncbi:MAG: gliding motility-associated-like protein [Crocinitomicaceae bacterium]|jgi:gliding motility-associated-like protein